jgi:hypothetical protein
MVAPKFLRRERNGSELFLYVTFIMAENEIRLDELVSSCSVRTDDEDHANYDDDADDRGRLFQNDDPVMTLVYPASSAFNP